MTTATGYQLGSTSCPFPHLGTFATADDAHDTAEVLSAHFIGRTYTLHVLLSDGTDRNLRVEVKGRQATRVAAKVMARNEHPSTTVRLRRGGVLSAHRRHGS
jgi:hypothetical protein